MRTVTLVKSAERLFSKRMLIGTDRFAKTMSWSHLSRTNSTPHPPLERLWQSSRMVHVAPDLVCHSSTSPHAYKSSHFGAPNSLHVELSEEETLPYARVVVTPRRLRLHGLMIDVRSQSFLLLSHMRCPAKTLIARADSALVAAL